jgi:hypothetical protein
MGAVTPGPPGPGPTGPGSADPTEAPRNGASGSPVPQGPETRRQDVVADGRSGEPAEDPGNLTMTRSQLGKLKGPERPVATLTGASVHGVRCPSGHPNPPAATMCRICGIGLGDADPVSMPRPLLGRLLFSNGTEVQLDRPAIVGRLPKAERVSARELPQLVTVPSPDKDISRNHLEVRIDGWHVLVVDLGSTNGTVVTMPGQPPERLRAGEEQPIVPGTVVTIADEITFVYEVSG